MGNASLSGATGFLGSFLAVHINQNSQNNNNEHYKQGGEMHSYLPISVKRALTLKAVLADVSIKII